MDFVADWSNLPTDLLGFIAGYLTIIEDFNAFKGVCTGWRSAAIRSKFPSVSTVPLLMLAEKPGKREREFYSLAKRKICMRTPTLPGVKNKKCLDVGFGWILTLDNSGEVCLVKPFSYVRIRLPKFTKFPDYSPLWVQFLFISRALLTANPSETSDFMLLVATTYSLGFWRNRDYEWNTLEVDSKLMVYRDKKLFALLTHSKPSVQMWDLHGNDPLKPKRVIRMKNAPTFSCDKWDNYLVESTGGELLLITRNNTSQDDYVTTGADHFDVMRVDLAKGECIEISDLGKDAIFVGDNAAVSVDATKFPGVLKPNCIYFTDDQSDVYLYSKKCGKGGGKDMGIYSVADGTIERFDVQSFSRKSPPMWIFPSFVLEMNFK